MEKLTGETLDIKEENIKAVTELFPEAVAEGKIDFAKLKQLLGEYVTDDNEKYEFRWNGKGGGNTIIANSVYGHTASV